MKANTKEYLVTVFAGIEAKLADLQKQQNETIYELKTSVIKPLSMPITEAAKYRGCSVTHLRQLIKKDILKPVDVGHTGVNIATKDLENLPETLAALKKGKSLQKVK